MHYLYFVKIVDEDIKTSEEARHRASSILTEENFTSEGYFGGGKADWFVVGGRWSGELHELFNPKFDEKEFRKISKEILQKDGENFISVKDIKDNKEELQKQWIKCGGTLENIYTRNNYDYLGSEDDGVLIDTEEKHKKLIQFANEKYRKEKDSLHSSVEVFDTDYFEEYSVDSIEWENNPYWLVVIDYHN